MLIVKGNLSFYLIHITKTNSLTEKIQNNEIFVKSYRKFFHELKQKHKKYNYCAYQGGNGHWVIEVPTITGTYGSNII